MTTTNRFPGSHQQTKLFSNPFQKTHTSDSSLHCPHRYRTVIPNWPENPEVSLSKICLIASCNCCTFCQTFIAHCLNFNTRFQHSLVCTSTQKMEAGSSWRVRIAAPHIPHVPYVFTYSIIKVHTPTCVGGQKTLCLFWIKSILDLPAQKAHKHSLSAMNSSVKIMCFSGMASL